MERSDKMESVIDTNVLVYAVCEDSIFHGECLKKLAKLNKIYFPLTVVEEFVLVLKGLEIPENLAKKQIKSIISDPRVRLINFDLKMLNEILEILQKERISIERFNDKLILISAKKMGLPLYTYDKELKKECKKFGVELFS